MSNSVEIKVIQIANKQMSLWYSRSTLVSLMCMFSNSATMMGGFWNDFQSCRRTHPSIAYNPLYTVDVPLHKVTHTVDSMYFKNLTDTWLYASITPTNTVLGKLTQSMIDLGVPFKGKLAAIGSSSNAREAINIRQFAIHIEQDILHQTCNTVNAPLDSIAG